MLVSNSLLVHPFSQLGGVESSIIPKEFDDLVEEPIYCLFHTPLSLITVRTSSPCTKFTVR